MRFIICFISLCSFLLTLQGQRLIVYAKNDAIDEKTIPSNDKPYSFIHRKVSTLFMMKNKDVDIRFTIDNQLLMETDSVIVTIDTNSNHHRVAFFLAHRLEPPCKAIPDIAVSLSDKTQGAISVMIYVPKSVSDKWEHCIKRSRNNKLVIRKKMLFETFQKNETFQKTVSQIKLNNNFVT